MSYVIWIIVALVYAYFFYCLGHAHCWVRWEEWKQNWKQHHGETVPD